MQAQEPCDRTETAPRSNRPRGVFITGNDTGVGKTFVGCELAKMLRERGVKVGVYKPVASGCVWRAGELVSEDAVALWEAAGRPRSLHEVCPQRFEAPLAPNLAAIAEGRSVNATLMRDGATAWFDEFEFAIVEGAGGYFSPLSDVDLNADLAIDLGLPILLVIANRLGAINQALTAGHAIRTYRGGLPLAGVVLNEVKTNSDGAAEGNLSELQTRMAGELVLSAAHGNGQEESLRFKSVLDAIYSRL